MAPMPSIRPFRFTGLPKLSQRQVAIQESLARYLSYRPFAEDFEKQLGGTLETYLKAPVRFSISELQPVDANELGRLLPATTCLLVIGAAPTEHKLIVDLDGGIASYCIDRLLGGGGEAGRIQRALTEIEEGVLSFVLLKVLQGVHDGWQTGRELTLSLDRFAATLDDISDILVGIEGFQMVGVRLAVGKRVGYARILLPDALVTTSFSSPPAQSDATAMEMQAMRRVLNALGDVPVLGRVEIATLDLGPEDIAQIEPGDIIILENHRVTKTPLGLEGEAFVKLGTGDNGGLRGRLVNESETVRLEVTELVVQETPPEAPMADGELPQDMTDQELEGVADPGDNLEQAGGLLRDVPAPVVVELGRIKMNTNQVVRLRAGQVLRLPRGPHDPVNLVVNGKLFARGELIEVDGELGVRLIQVAGS